MLLLANLGCEMLKMKRLRLFPERRLESKAKARRKDSNV